MNGEIPGYVTQRRLEDARVVAVSRMLFNGRLIIGDDTYVHDAWCYASVPAALAAFAEWDPSKAEEPTGWTRHPASGRRRPDGDASKEYVNR